MFHDTEASSPSLRTSFQPFQAWLESLSLDAAQTDLCPNLACIPLSQLQRLYAEGCPPGAEAIIDWQPQHEAPGALGPQDAVRAMVAAFRQ